MGSSLKIGTWETDSVEMTGNRAAAAVLAGWLAVVPCEAGAVMAETTCATAQSPRPLPIFVSNQLLAASRRPRAGGQLGSFTINLVAGATLQANAPALASFQRSVNAWAAFISDPITVTINGDLANLGAPNIIGQTGAVLLQGGFDLVRNQLVTDADADDGLMAALPTAAQVSFLLPAGFTLNGSVVASKALFKAAGFTGLDAAFGASDATITFNTQFAFDFDNSDGVGPGLTDFETVATHELAHALGYISEVDVVDQNASGAVGPSPLDLYRFADGTANDPTTQGQFTTSARSLAPNSNDIFDDLATESRMSTGVAKGDGRQASHWKDDALTGVHIGIMDPTLGAATVFPITAADLRALDLVGYDIAATGTTTTTAAGATTTSIATTTTTIPPCQTAADCSDGNGCTEDACASGTCTHQAFDRERVQVLIRSSMDGCAGERTPRALRLLTHQAERLVDKAGRKPAKARRLQDRAFTRITSAITKADTAEQRTQISADCASVLDERLRAALAGLGCL